ncbi:MULTISPECIES: hypothetical protein [Brevundimonas]|uniref:hypothetical protein n=1 Tax=Brevundimonas TaxID=41275 RepID=UPI000F02D8AF|nr:hypothetical protein [Brevundimonas lutea]
MTVRIFDVTLIGGLGGDRVVRVPAKTGVQAQDAAVALAKPHESIGDVVEVEDDLQRVDTGLPGTQTHPDQPV